MQLPLHETQAVVRRYHDSWSRGRFDDAVALLAEELRVEVPINDYPTRASFATALAGFGRAVEKVELLSEMACDDQAMLLYDLRVTGLGTLRVVEHFIVRDGRIVQLRQIHDTAALRAAGWGA